MPCDHSYESSESPVCTKCGHKARDGSHDRRSKLPHVGLGAVAVIGILIAYVVSAGVLLPDGTPEPNALPITSKEHVLDKKVDRDELIQHALSLVNKDRAEHGLMPLDLSANKAAQVHADDVLKTRVISHWLTTGEKPYLTYAKYGGTGGVRQNIAFIGATDVEQCVTPEAECDLVDPFVALEQSERKMMSDDSDSAWGHRNDILNPKHTHVSFGIAYDKYSFVLVQNFEYNYIDFDATMGQDPSNMRITGSVLEGRLYNISVYYDPLPTSQAYAEHKDESLYGFGRMVAIVEPPLPPNSYYLKSDDHSLIVAHSMSQEGVRIDASFDMSSVATEPGIYTVAVWLESDGTYIPATTHSVLVVPSSST